MNAKNDSQSSTIVVNTRRGGFRTAVAFVCTLLLFILIFIFGAIAGMLSRADDPVRVETYRQEGRDQIAVVTLTGPVDPAMAKFMRHSVDSILDDWRGYRAVVLRVDSPGGMIAPSDQIWRQVERLKEHNIPVVASYGGLAASGGYYISCGADEIIAEPTCITGSVGVIAMLFTVHNLMDKIGLEPVVLIATSSPEKDRANNPFRQWTAEDRDRILMLLDDAHETFRTRVRDGRQHVITDDQTLASVTDGSIFTAQQAVDVGLVDGIGYLDDAIAAAERRGGISPGRATVHKFTPAPRFGLPLGVSAIAGDHESIPIWSRNADELRSLLHDLTSVQLLYRMP